MFTLGCESEDEASTTESGGAMAGGEMAAGAMAGGEMAAGAMAGGEMAAGAMAGGEMAGGEMAGGEMAGGAMPGGAMAGGAMAGGAMTGGEMGAGGAEPPFMADCSMPNMMCYTPRASPGGNPRLMIQVVNVPASTVELVNRTNEDINLNGWVIVQGDTATALLANDDAFVVGALDTLVLAMGVAGSVEGADTLEMAGELALYSEGSAEQPANLRAYLAWGAASPSEAAVQAAALGLWPAGEYAGICGDNIGLVGVGDVSGPNGYRSVPANCF